MNTNDIHAGCYLTTTIISKLLHFPSNKAFDETARSKITTLPIEQSIRRDCTFETNSYAIPSSQPKFLHSPSSTGWNENPRSSLLVSWQIVRSPFFWNRSHVRTAKCYLLAFYSTRLISMSSWMINFVLFSTAARLFPNRTNTLAW